MNCKDEKIALLVACQKH